MYRRTLFHLLLLTNFVGLTATTSLGETQTPPRSIPIPGGMADTVRSTAYLTGGDGLTAVSLETGKELWTAPTPARPLLAVPSGILALSPDKDRPNLSHVLLLGAEKGEQLLRSESLSFPAWVRLEPTAGRSFTTDTAVDAKGALLIWQARAWYAGGAPPTEEAKKNAAKAARGAFRVDLKAGTVETLKEVPATARPRLELPDALKDITSKTYLVGEQTETRPLIVGDRVTVLDEEKAEVGNKLLLRRWDRPTGKALAPVELLSGEKVTMRLTQDGQHLLTWRAGMKGEPERVGAIFSLESGDRIGTSCTPEGARDVSIVGNRAYCAVMKAPRPGAPAPRTLRAVDLKSGETLWERPLPSSPPLPPRPTPKPTK